MVTTGSVDGTPDTCGSGSSLTVAALAPPSDVIVLPSAVTLEVDSPTVAVRVGVLMMLWTRSLSVVVTGSTFTGEPAAALATLLSRSDTALATGVVTGARAPLRTVLALSVALATDAELLATGLPFTTEVEADEQARPRSRTLLIASPTPGSVGVPQVWGLTSAPLPLVD